MGFDNYAGPLRIYLQKYREAVKGGVESPAKRARQEAKEAKAAVGASSSSSSSFSSRKSLRTNANDMDDVNFFILDQELDLDEVDDIDEES